MERGSTKHAHLLDDEMAEEVDSLTRGAPGESRASESRQHEPSADGDPQPDRLEIPDPGTPERLSHDDVAARSELARFLRPSIFPAAADEVIAAARAEHATEAVLTALLDLDAGRHYETLEEVWEALGGRTEHRPEPDEPPAVGTAADRSAELPEPLVPVEPEPEPVPAAGPDPLVARPPEPLVPVAGGASSEEGGRAPAEEGAAALVGKAARAGFVVATVAVGTVAGVLGAAARAVGRLGAAVAQGKDR